MTFERGQSGNPSGRPVGVGRVHELRRLLQTKAVDVIESVIQKAIDGDSFAQKMIIDRLLPTLRPIDLPVSIPQPDSNDPGDQAAIVVSHLLSGGLSADTAAKVMQTLVMKQAMTEIKDLADRIARLEEVSTNDHDS